MSATPQGGIQLDFTVNRGPVDAAIAELRALKVTVPVTFQPGSTPATPGTSTPATFASAREPGTSPAIPGSPSVAYQAQQSNAPLMAAAQAMQQAAQALQAAVSRIGVQQAIPGANVTARAAGMESVPASAIVSGGAQSAPLSGQERKKLTELRELQTVLGDKTPPEITARIAELEPRLPGNIQAARQAAAVQPATPPPVTIAVQQAGTPPVLRNRPVRAAQPAPALPGAEEDQESEASAQVIPLPLPRGSARSGFRQARNPFTPYGFARSVGASVGAVYFAYRAVQAISAYQQAVTAQEIARVRGDPFDIPEDPREVLIQHIPIVGEARVIGTARATRAEDILIEQARNERQIGLVRRETLFGRRESVAAVSAINRQTAALGIQNPYRRQDMENLYQQMNLAEQYHTQLENLETQAKTTINPVERAQAEERVTAFRQNQRPILDAQIRNLNAQRTENLRTFGLESGIQSFGIQSQISELSTYNRIDPNKPPAVRAQEAEIKGIVNRITSEQMQAFASGHPELINQYRQLGVQQLEAYKTDFVRATTYENVSPRNTAFSGPATANFGEILAQADRAKGQLKDEGGIEQTLETVPDKLDTVVGYLSQMFDQIKNLIAQ